MMPMPYFSNFCMGTPFGLMPKVGISLSALSSPSCSTSDLLNHFQNIEMEFGLYTAIMLIEMPSFGRVVISYEIFYFIFYVKLLYMQIEIWKTMRIFFISILFATQC